MLAEAHAAPPGPDLWLLFTWESPAIRGALGACHALELPFVFGTLHFARLCGATCVGAGPAADALRTADDGRLVDGSANGRPWLAGLRRRTPADDGVRRRERTERFAARRGHQPLYSRSRLGATPLK